MCYGPNRGNWNQNPDWQGQCGPFWHQRGPFWNQRGFRPFWFGARNQWGESEFRESTNFNEESNQYELSIEVPGISKEKIKVKANNEFLFVTVDNRKTEEEKPYERRFSFRQVVDLGKIKAKYNNGLLYIEVPLKESEKQDIPVD